MNEELPDTKFLEDSIAFDSDAWIVRSNASYSGKNNITFKFDFIFEHRISGLKVLMLKLSGSNKIRYNQLAILNLLLNSLDETIRVFVISCKWRHNEKKLLDALNSNLTKKVGVYDSTGKTKWYGEPENQHLSKKREKSAVIREIISLLGDHECKITEVVYKCNLNYAKASDLLSELIEKKMIMMDIQDGTKLFKATREGLEFARKLTSLQV